jgi:fucose permease
MLNHLINGPIGFAWAVRSAALITFGCFIIGNALIFIPRRQISSPSTHGWSTQSKFEIRHQLWDIPYILTLASAFLSGLGVYTPTFYVQLFAETKGVKKVFVYNALAIMNAGSVIGRIVPSWYADKFGAINVYIPLRLTQGECLQRS